MEEPSAQRIEQRIERNETQMQYQQHTRWLRSYALKAGGWMPKVVVVIPADEGNGEHEMEGEATCAAREEADQQAVRMGRAWIERKGAGEVSEKDISLP